MRVFEIDRPETLERKTGILKKIFGQTAGPCRVHPPRYRDRGRGGRCWKRPVFPGQKTLFLLEGLVMYLPCRDVEELLAGIAEHAGAGQRGALRFRPAIARGRLHPMLKAGRTSGTGRSRSASQSCPDLPMAKSSHSSPALGTPGCRSSPPGSLQGCISRERVRTGRSPA